jgi:hypothetical protein
MEWAQVVVLFLANIALVIPLFIWNRTESRSDMRHMDAKLEAHRRECMDLITAIQQEMKDFHGRLCEIESRK